MRESIHPNYWYMQRDCQRTGDRARHVKRERGGKRIYKCFIYTYEHTYLTMFRLLSSLFWYTAPLVA